MINDRRINRALTIIILVSLILLMPIQELKSLRKSVDSLWQEKERLRVSYLEVKEKYLELMERHEELEERYKELRDSYSELTEGGDKDRRAKTSSTRAIGEGQRSRDLGTFIATAYDNTAQSQGKWIDQTATGFNLKGHTLESARCIAVDPSVIPLHSKVHLTFSDPYEHLNGVYTAYDTGGAIKGRKIDVFFGDGDVRQAVMQFGRREVKIELIEAR